MVLTPGKDVYAADVPLWQRGQHGGITRPIDPVVLHRNLKEVVEVFETCGVRYCIIFGLALGLLRENDAIAHDDDVDIAIFSEDRPKLARVRTLLREKGHFVPDAGDPQKPIDIRTNMPHYDFVAIKDGEKIDGWLFDKIGKFYVYDPPRAGLAIPARHFDAPLPTWCWRGQAFNVPRDLEAYIALMYGPTWRTPNPECKPNMPQMKDFKNMSKIHIGCGTVYLDGWVNVDLPCEFCFLAEDRPDLVDRYRTPETDYYGRHGQKTIDVLRKGAVVNEYVCDRYGRFFFIPAAAGTATEILARSVFEHLSLSEAAKALAEVKRVLAPDGVLRLDVPDHDATMKEFARTGDDFFIRHLLGPRKTKFGYHCVSYTREALKEFLAGEGFVYLGEEENIHPYPSFCFRFGRAR